MAAAKSAVLLMRSTERARAEKNKFAGPFSTFMNVRAVRAVKSRR